MLKLLKANLREVISLLVIVAVLLIGLFLLQSRAVSESGETSTAISVLVTILGGTLRFVVCLALAWFGLAVTFPEANRFVVGIQFDGWWQTLPVEHKAIVALVGVAVLAIVAALCMAG